MRYLAIILVAFALTACHDSNPPVGGEGEAQIVADDSSATTDGNDTRPGAPDALPDDIITTLDDAELLDATSRYQGPALNLRYGTPGILTSTLTLNTPAVQLTDIDGNDRAAWSCDGYSTADSAAVNPSLTVNGAAVALAATKRLKTTSDATWITAVDSDGALHLIVY